MRWAEARLLRTLLTAALISGASLATANRELAEPFATANRNPFALITGLPAAQSAVLLADGRSRFLLNTEWANTATRSARADQQVVIDGETRRTAIGWDYGSGRQPEDSSGAGLRGQLQRRATSLWQFGIELAWVDHSGGQLDGFIEDWHDTFGLPNGERDDYPADVLEYRYRDRRETLALTDSVSGRGDLRLKLARRLNDRRSIHASLKLPTGDADRLTGSGGSELTLAFHHSDYDWRQWWGDSWHVHGSIGVLVSERGDVLAARREPLTAFGSSTLVWQWSPQLALKAQLDLHSRLYDSDLRELGRGSAQLVLGGSWQVTPQWVLDLAVSEDIAVETAPDVVFQFTLRWRR